MKKNVKKIIALSVLAVFLSACQTETTIKKETAAKSKVEPDYKKAYQDYVMLGTQYLDRGALEMAEQRFKRAIEIDARQPDAWNGLAIVYEESRNIAEGDRTYQKLINSHPDYALGYSNYLIFLCKFDRENEMSPVLAKMRAKGKEFAALSYIGEGDCNIKKNRVAQAENSYKQAIAIEQNSAGALMPLAKIALDKGQPQAAQAYLKVMHTYVGYTPESVKLGILAARAMNDSKSETDLTRIMRSSYSKTKQAEELGI